MKTFKDKRGAHRTESLFVETIQPEIAKNYTPVYSLRDYDNKGYPSAYNIFMSAIDERDAALKLVGSMAHWRKLCSLKWFIEGRPICQFEGLKQWRQDMKDRDATEAKRVLQSQMLDNNVTAAKAVLAESKTTAKNSTKSIRKTKPLEDDNVTQFLKTWEEK